MKIGYKINISLKLYHKTTGEQINVQKVVSDELDEHSEEYKRLCGQYRQTIGFNRESNTENFDTKLAKILCEQAEGREKEIIANTTDVIKKCMLGKSDGVVQFGGVIFNPCDFCAVEFEDFSARFFKR